MVGRGMTLFGNTADKRLGDRATLPVGERIELPAQEGAKQQRYGKKGRLKLRVPAFADGANAFVDAHIERMTAMPRSSRNSPLRRPDRRAAGAYTRKPACTFVEICPGR